jgi:hypothetical protein
MRAVAGLLGAVTLAEPVPVLRPGVRFVTGSDEAKAVTGDSSTAGNRKIGLKLRRMTFKQIRLLINNDCAAEIHGAHRKANHSNSTQETELEMIISPGRGLHCSDVGALRLS